MLRHLLLLAALAVAVDGCGATQAGSVQSNSPAAATTSPGPAASASPETSQTTTGLKLALIDKFGPLWYCDPDIYPIARDTETDRALARWSEVTSDRATADAIATHLGISLGANPTTEQKVAVYGVWKLVNAIALEPQADGSYRFNYLARPKEGSTEGTRVTGSISATGAVTIENQTPEGQPNCPICLARGSLIETPAGGVPVESLTIGTEVWTLDGQGRRVTGTVLARGSTTAPTGHHVVHLVLADGRSVTASPGHPLADGRPLGEIRKGDGVAGSTGRDRRPRAVRGSTRRSTSSSRARPAPISSTGSRSVRRSAGRTRGRGSRRRARPPPSDLRRTARNARRGGSPRAGRGDAVPGPRTTTASRG